MQVTHGVDPVGQRQRQQAAFDRRADLAGVHGQEDVRQIAQNHQRIDQTTEQKGRPGDHKITRHPQTSGPGHYARDKNDHDKCQRQRRGQPQGHGITGDQRQQHDQRTHAHQQDQRTVQPAALRADLQKGARKLAAKERSRADQKRHRRVGPPRVVGPEVLHRCAVDRELVQAKRGHIDDVIQVAGVTHADVDEQVVHQHPQQNPVNQAQHINALGLFFEVGLCGPQGERRLNRAFAGQTQVDGLALPRAEIEFEKVVVFFDLPVAEGQGIAGALSQIVVARRIGQVQVDVVQRRVRQLHQPGAVCCWVFGQVAQINF